MCSSYSAHLKGGSETAQGEIACWHHCILHSSSDCLVKTSWASLATIGYSLPSPPPKHSTWTQGGRLQEYFWCLTLVKSKSLLWLVSYLWSGADNISITVTSKGIYIKINCKFPAKYINYCRSLMKETCLNSYNMSSTLLDPRIYSCRKSKFSPFWSSKSKWEWENNYSCLVLKILWAGQW